MERLGKAFDDLAQEAQDAFAEGDTNKAIDLFCKTLDLVDLNIEPDKHIEIQLKLADAYRVQGSITKAGQVTDAALAAAREILDEQSEVYVLALNDSAVQKHYEQQIEEARSLYEQAVEIADRSNISADLHSTCLANLANLLSRHFMEFAPATKLFRRALKLLADDPTAAATLHSIMALLASHHNESGNHEEAVDLLQRVLDFRRSNYGSESESVAETLSLLAHQFAQLGEYASALPCLSEARRIFVIKAALTDWRYAKVCERLSGIHHRLRNYSVAEEMGREADKINSKLLGDDHPFTLYNRRSLAVTLSQLGREDEAEALMAAVLDGLERAFGVHSRDYAQTLHERGTGRSRHGDFNGALTDIRHARELRAKILGTEAYDYAITLNSEAQILGQMGEHDDAVRLLRQATETLEELGTSKHTTFSIVLHNLAIEIGLAGDISQAMALLDRAAKIDDIAIRETYVLGSRRGRIGLAAEIRSKMTSYVGILALTNETEGHLVDRVASYVLRHKALEYELEAELARSAYKPATIDVAHLIDEIRGLEMEVAAARARASRNNGDVGANVTVLQQRIDKLVLEVWKRSPMKTIVDNAREWSGEVLSAQLSSGEVLLEFVVFDTLGNEKSYQLGCFVFRHGFAPRFRIMAPHFDVQSAVDTFLRTLLDNRWEKKLTPECLAQRDVVRRLIFDPILPWLDGVRHLFVCPDGNIGRLPFDILSGADNTLETSWVVTYNAVGRDIFRPAFGASPKNGAIFAGPRYSIPSIDRVPEEEATNQQDAEVRNSPWNPINQLRGSRRLFRDLHGSRIEGEQIAELTGADLYFAENASKTVLQSLISPRFLHIATHGFYLPRPNDGIKLDLPITSLMEHPMYRCGLALANADSFWATGTSWNLDGVVTGAEVAQLRLSGTRLVVLSACDTAVGDTEIGEGIFSLHRALLIAGAACVVACLWPVEDRAARLLIEVFYRGLMKGLCVRDALWQARIVRRDMGSPLGDWTAFACFGDSNIKLIDAAD